MGQAKLKAVRAIEPVKLDLGCGINKRAGFIGVDCRKADGVDHVVDLTDRWPWASNSVDEVHCSHVIEHFGSDERIHFVNELYRVLRPKATATIITPHWASTRAYGDLTHAWPPVAEMWFYYLDKEWRKANAPHNDFYTCDFMITWGYQPQPELQVRNLEYQQYAMQHYKEAIMDMVATFTKKEQT